MLRHNILFLFLFISSAAIAQSINGINNQNIIASNTSAYVTANNITTVQLNTPTAPTATASTTGGSLAAATYTISIAALDKYGSTAAGASTAVTTTGTTSSIALSWGSVTGAVSYNVWLSTGQYFNTTTNGFTLTTATGTSGTIPTTNTTGGADFLGPITVPSCTGCGGGGSVSGTQYGSAYFATSSSLGNIAPPTANGSYFLEYNVSAGAAVAPTAVLAGLTTRLVSGTTSTDTTLYSDNDSLVEYDSSVSVAVTLPTATTLGNANFYSVLANYTTGTSTTVTVTPTTWTINGGTSFVIQQQQTCSLSVDPSSTTNWLIRCNPANTPAVAGTYLAGYNPVTGTFYTGTLSGASATESGVQQAAYTYAADTGTANAYVVSISPAPTIVAGSVVRFLAKNSNTGASTIAVNGGTATALDTTSKSALPSGAIAAGGIYEAEYDGTEYQCLNCAVSSTAAASTSFVTPRDVNFQLAVPVRESTAYSTIGMYLANSVGTLGSGATDTSGHEYFPISTGTTSGTQQGEMGTASLYFINPSAQIMYGVSSATGVNIWLGMCSYCNVSVSGTLTPGTTSAVAIAGFRHFSGTEATDWVCYLGNTTNGTTLDSTVAVDTTGLLHEFDVIEVSGVYEFFIDRTRVCSTIAQTYLPTTSTNLGVFATWENTTTTSITSNIGKLYVGNN